MNRIAAISLLFLATPAIAAPQPDPKILGKWHCDALPAWADAGQLTVTFRPNGTQTRIFTSSKHTVVTQASFTTQSNFLTETFLSATDNGIATNPHDRYFYTYKIKGNTLTLILGGAAPNFAFHRVKG